ncbi:hypothetical protein [Lacinutrix sp. MEBiC02404]
MRTILVSFVLCFSFVFTYAQDDNTVKKSINDFNFESVSNPAFSILDETPSAINTPDNLKSLGLYLSNGFSNSNIAVEINPYWIFGEQDTSYEAYRGIKKSDAEAKISPFKAFSTNSSISIAYLEKEFNGFDEAKKVLAIGGRGTIFEYYGKERTREVLKVVNAMDTGFSKNILEVFNDFLAGTLKADGSPLGAPDEIQSKAYIDTKVIPKEYLDAGKSFLSKLPQYASLYNNSAELVKDYFEEASERIVNFVFNPKTIKPLLRIDGAAAYSILFKDSNIDSNTARRIGAWVSLDLALKFSDKNYIHVLAIGKYVDDGFNLNADGYFDTSFWDYGGKVEFDINKFRLSYEYIAREGFGEQYRSVGNITYQLSKKMSIVGGFGKDFPVDNNLVSIIGINWGLDLGESSFTK